ncbi:hypothetical protein HanIR_Chr13g0618971 [Helianthus annuus]|nr:hypothetical protein HanIR_Chr13g0618971 [Helianthus annuus]
MFKNKMIWDALAFMHKNTKIFGSVISKKIYKYYVVSLKKQFSPSTFLTISFFLFYSKVYNFCLQIKYTKQYTHKKPFNDLRVVCLPLNEALNGSDLLLVQHLMVQTVCFVSRCLNGSDICL